MQPLSCLALVGRRLGTEAEKLDAQTSELCMLVAEPTRLWRAAASARNEVPSVRQRRPWYARHRIAIDDRPRRGELVEPDGRPAGGCQRDRRERHADEMVAGAIVHRGRQLRRKLLVTQLKTRFLDPAFSQAQPLALPTTKNAMIGAL